MRNFEGYADPTACIAIGRVTRAEKWRRRISNEQNKKTISKKSNYSARSGLYKRADSHNLQEHSAIS